MPRPARCSSACTWRPTTAATRRASRACCSTRWSSWALGHGDTLRLEVHEDNPRARRFYEKLGFTLTGRSREYELEPGGLELEMIKPLR